tara:strand:- start:3935 stop:4564 length:630 start_codon:yes stop_codon:yes gene_type:complete
MNIEIIDVLNDGSCFYRSLYFSLRYTANINLFLRLFFHEEFSNKWTEEYFISRLRSFLSKSIKNGNDFDISENTFISLTSYDFETYTLIINTLFDESISLILENKPKTLKKFRNILSKNILLNSTWVTQIEIEIIQKIIDNQINLEILHKIPNYKLNSKTVYLLNINEIHYNYILCRKLKENKIINPKTKRLVHINKITHQKLQLIGVP